MLESFLHVLLTSAKASSANREFCSSVCGHCPFRKDRPRWLTLGLLILNQLRLLHRTKQDCHLQPGKLCLGQTLMFSGGNESIYSPQELLEYAPVPEAASHEQYTFPG